MSSCRFVATLLRSLVLTYAFGHMADGYSGPNPLNQGLEFQCHNRVILVREAILNLRSRARRCDFE
jgi:hypothetical protein